VTPLMANGKPNPTGTGRYCAPRACYCGRHPSYRPLPEPDYTRLVAAAERAAKKQQRAWAQREESTWIDELR
jgi:hypothetical protein